MRLFKDYSKWPLGRQLQIQFILSAFFISGLAIGISYMQLWWIRYVGLEKTEEMLNDNIEDHMKLIGSEMSQYVAQVILQYIGFVKEFRSMMQTVKINQPFDMTGRSYVMHNEIEAEDLVDYGDRTDVTLKYGVFFTKEVLSTEGEALIYEVYAMDLIFESLLYPDYFAMYAGFETNYLFYFYPGYKKLDEEYNPKVREWYYKAYENRTEMIITEPYTDYDTGEWMISVSQSIDEDETAIGVAAVDITLTTLYEKLENVVILDEGFILLVSEGGMVISMPETWKNATGEETFRIFDEEKTGISQEDWEGYVSDIGSREIFEITDINDIKYSSVIYEVRPVSEITHYLIACAPKDEIKEPLDELEDDIGKTFDFLFYAVVVIAGVDFLIISIMIYWTVKKVSKKLSALANFLSKLVHRGLFPYITEGIDYRELETETKGMVGLSSAFLGKLSRIDNLEGKYAYFDWDVTRPHDEFIYNEWKKKLYPCSKEEVMPWRNLLYKLNQLHFKY